jgi:hypothetical protein
VEFTQQQSDLRDRVREHLAKLPDHPYIAGGPGSDKPIVRYPDILLDVIADAIVTFGVRNQEYSPGSDPFSNLKRGFEFGLVAEPWHRPLIDVLDNIQSVAAMCRTGNLGSTDRPKDRIIDAGNYCFLAEAMRRQYVAGDVEYVTTMGDLDE